MAIFLVIVLGLLILSIFLWGNQYRLNVAAPIPVSAAVLVGLLTIFTIINDTTEDKTVLTGVDAVNQYKYTLIIRCINEIKCNPAEFMDSLGRAFTIPEVKKLDRPTNT